MIPVMTFGDVVQVFVTGYILGLLTLPVVGFISILLERK